MSSKYHCTVSKPGRVGEVSSKYGYPGGGEQFEADIAQKAMEAEALYEKFVAWMVECQVTPDTVRSMFVRFYYDFCETKKEEKEVETL